MTPGIRFVQREPMGTSTAPLDALTKARVVSIDDSPQFAAETMDIADLYPEIAHISPILGHALRALAAAREAAEEALEAMKRGDWMASDESMQRLQALLPELFCCRDIGDGFGAIINALRLSFVNAKGVPLSEPQIKLIRYVLERIRQEPFLHFDQAAELIESLEDTGLIVDPPSFAVLGELLDVEGLR
jgi:hypothetical protein